MLLLIVVGAGWLLSGTLARLARPIANARPESANIEGTQTT
jgi:hypothetical protein